MTIDLHHLEDERPGCAVGAFPASRRRSQMLQMYSRWVRTILGPQIFDRERKATP